MAIRMLTAKEIGGRVSEVLKRTGLGSVEMSLAMGKDKQFLSRWTTGRRKRIDRPELISIANFAEGKGDFHSTDARTILAFFDGDFDSWDVALRPNLRLVTGSEADLAPGGRVELPTSRLTVDRSATELPRNDSEAPDPQPSD